MAGVAGSRDRTFRIEQNSSSTGTSRFPVDTWTTLAALVYAQRVDAANWRGENYVANQIAAVANVMWKIDYRSDMDPELVAVPKVRRLVTPDGRIHNIVAAEVVGRREAIKLFTSAKAD